MMIYKIIQFFRHGERPDFFNIIFSDFHAFSIASDNKIGVTEKILALVKFSNNTHITFDRLLNYGRDKLEEYKIPKEFYPHPTIKKIFERLHKYKMDWIRRKIC